MRDQAPALRARGASLAAVGLGNGPLARAFREELAFDFPLLLDEDRVAYRAAGLVTVSPASILWPGNVAAAVRALAEGHRQGRTGRHPLQLGGSLVLGPGDVDRFVHVSRAFGDNAPVRDLLAALDA